MVMKIFAGHPEPGPGHQDEDFLHVLNSALGGHPHYEAAAGEDGEAEAAAKDHQFIVLSDRNIGKARGHVSSALAVGAVHHHLINTRYGHNSKKL